MRGGLLAEDQPEEEESVEPDTGDLGHSCGEQLNTSQAPLVVSFSLKFTVCNLKL